ncbi:serine/threonine-protein phosphatase 7 long form homolog [Arachis duranensis]|uniref:Serine/threonine-protein phosphatase 7 long form homolog n=1 Tax=Arachis duranensis TaxID=130453 RepID=A0A9C6TLF8_ARADU|nr:serine/threonine-protein phosphatase 7 long form homolog [Arachis duranensis]
MYLKPSTVWRLRELESSRMLICDHPVPLDRYNERVEEHLRSTGFYHVAQIGVVQCQKVLINALVEMWHPDTHTFHLPVGECAVTLEDVAMILGLPTDGLLVTGMTLSSFEALEVKCLHQFGVAPRKSDCRGRCIKLTWLWDLKARLQLTDENSIPVYVKCHIMLLIGTILFGDKSRASVHWKFLPLLRDFASIGQCSWGSACLAYLYRALCRASCFDCKEIDGPVTLLLGWAWIRLPYLAPAPREPRSFSLANRFRRQFGFVQGVPHQEPNLDKEHGEVLTGPKNLNWATATTHSFWVMQWTNRYNHVLTEFFMAPQHPLDIYMYWYRSKYGNHLNLSNLVVQEDVEGNQVMDDDNQEHEPQSPPPPPPPPPLLPPQFSSQYVPQTQFTPSFPIHQQY